MPTSCASTPTRSPDGWMGLDIGPTTQELFTKTIAGSGTVIWNGPMGVSRVGELRSRYCAQSQRLSQSAAGSRSSAAATGAAAVEKLGYADKMTHISTGGGRISQRIPRGLELPGIACLRINKKRRHAAPKAPAEPGRNGSSFPLRPQLFARRLVRRQSTARRNQLLPDVKKVYGKLDF